MRSARGVKESFIFFLFFLFFFFEISPLGKLFVTCQLAARANTP
jgi:hypothetical protein